MLMVAVSLPVSAPPGPVLPLSLIASVSVALADGVSVLWLYLAVMVVSVLSSALICAIVPVIVTDELPLFVTIAPLLLAVRGRVPSVKGGGSVYVWPTVLTSLTARPLFLSDR